jgi:hypothetical protein
MRLLLLSSPGGLWGLVTDASAGLSLCVFEEIGTIVAAEG